MGSLDSLKTKAEFDFVYRNGLCRYGKNFALYACLGVGAGVISAKRVDEAHQATRVDSRHIDSRMKHNIDRSINSGMHSSTAVPLTPITLGLSISRKVGNAITRNLLKRRVRMLCRESATHALRSKSYGIRSSHAGATSTLYLVFVAKSGIAAMSFSELKESFEKTFAMILHTLRTNQHTRASQPLGKAHRMQPRSHTRPHARPHAPSHGSRSSARMGAKHHSQQPAATIATSLAAPHARSSAQEAGGKTIASAKRGMDRADLPKRESHACY